MEEPFALTKLSARLMDDPFARTKLSTKRRTKLMNANLVSEKALDRKVGIQRGTGERREACNCRAAAVHGGVFGAL